MRRFPLYFDKALRKQLGIQRQPHGTNAAPSMPEGACFAWMVLRRGVFYRIGGVHRSPLLPEDEPLLPPGAMATGAVLRAEEAM